MVKRLRMFAGPNGSGKSTVFSNVERRFGTGYFVNADDIEQRFERRGFINLFDFGVNLTQAYFERELSNSHLVTKARLEGLDLKMRIVENVLTLGEQSLNSYAAAFVAQLIREQLILTGSSFSFETVMSHESKLKFLATASRAGYRVYLYFICTNSSDVNVERVQQRVAKGGHAVPVSKIVARYHRSLSLLPEAISLTHRTFIFDNSGKEHRLILDVYKGDRITIHSRKVPAWVNRSLISKLT